MQSISQTLIYLLIALPVVYGVYWRFKTRALIPRAMAVTSLVFGMVALGLVIYHYSDRQHPLESYPGFSTVEGAVAQSLGGEAAAPDIPRHEAAPRAHDPIGRVKERATRMADHPPRTWAHFITAGLLVLFFTAAGALMGVMGPILAGYTLTMALSSYFHGGTLHEIPLWRAFFEFFSINSGVMQLFCLISGSVLAVGDSMVSSFHRHGDASVGVG
jgi:hypothetical protein